MGVTGGKKRSTGVLGGTFGDPERDAPGVAVGVATAVAEANDSTPGRFGVNSPPEEWAAVVSEAFEGSPGMNRITSGRARNNTSSPEFQ